jgi:putative Holliday junction resolvase
MVQMDQATNTSILALDVGDARVGVAIASSAARLPRPLTTLERGDKFFEQLKAVVEYEFVNSIVVGLPRNLNGQETDQTASVQTFVRELKGHFDLDIHFQDEAVTSKQAEAELDKRGKPYKRGDIDALAATYILEDYLASKRA